MGPLPLPMSGSVGGRRRANIGGAARGTATARATSGRRFRAAVTSPGGVPGGKRRRTKFARDGSLSSALTWSGGAAPRTVASRRAVVRASSAWTCSCVKTGRASWSPYCRKTMLNPESEGGAALPCRRGNRPCW